MNADDFRRLALSMPGAVEAPHAKHPDFRAGRTVFATLGYPDGDWGMVKLTPEQQSIVTASQPDLFKAVAGPWGRRGSTQVLLKTLDEATAISALRMAWTNTVPG